MKRAKDTICLLQVFTQCDEYSETFSIEWTYGQALEYMIGYYNIDENDITETWWRIDRRYTEREY